jgi:hypothetical protein
MCVDPAYTADTLAIFTEYLPVSLVGLRDGEFGTNRHHSLPLLPYHKIIQRGMVLVPFYNCIYFDILNFYRKLIGLAELSL